MGNVKQNSHHKDYNLWYAFCEGVCFVHTIMSFSISSYSFSSFSSRSSSDTLDSWWRCFHSEKYSSSKSLYARTRVSTPHQQLLQRAETNRYSKGCTIKYIFNVQDLKYMYGNSVNDRQSYCEEICRVSMEMTCLCMI